MTYHNRQPYQQTATPSEIERLLHHMPTAARMAGDEFTRGFAQSVVKQSRRKGWKPTAKQLPIMRRMVSELFTHGNDDGGDFDLIES